MIAAQLRDDSHGHGGCETYTLEADGSYLQQVLLCEGLSNEGLYDLRAEVQAVLIHALGAKAEPHFIICLPTAKQGLAAVWDKALLDVLALGVQKLQDLQSVLQCITMSALSAKAAVRTNYQQSNKHYCWRQDGLNIAQLALQAVVQQGLQRHPTAVTGQQVGTGLALYMPSRSAAVSVTGLTLSCKQEACAYNSAA